jgi:Pyruvate/2-oxoacid:ferredoxin oxidoreductase gamma subunit
LLGAFVKASNIVSFEFLMKNLSEILGEGKSKLTKINREALQMGFDYVKECV